MGQGLYVRVDCSDFGVESSIVWGQASNLGVRLRICGIQVRSLGCRVRSLGLRFRIFGVRSLGSTIHFWGVRARTLGFRVFGGFGSCFGLNVRILEIGSTSTAHRSSLSRCASTGTCVLICLENATVCGRAWYKLLDAPVLPLDVTI